MKRVKCKLLFRKGLNLYINRISRFKIGAARRLSGKMMSNISFSLRKCAY